MTNEQTQPSQPELKWFGQRARLIRNLTLPGVVDHLPVFERRNSAMTVFGHDRSHAFSRG